MNIIIKCPYTPAFSRAIGHPVSVSQLRKIVGSPAHVRYGPYGVAVVYNPKSRTLKWSRSGTSGATPCLLDATGNG